MPLILSYVDLYIGHYPNVNFLNHHQLELRTDKNIGFSALLDSDASSRTLNLYLSAPNIRIFKGCTISCPYRFLMPTCTVAGVIPLSVLSAAVLPVRL